MAGMTTIAAVAGDLLRGEEVKAYNRPTRLLPALRQIMAALIS
jgi:hypothetical protein